MINDIKDLHRVTSMAADAATRNALFTGAFGPRLVKRTVNFNAPEVYHLHYRDAVGPSDSMMAYFPFSHMPNGRPGSGEVGATEFAMPKSGLPLWTDRLTANGIGGLTQSTTIAPRFDRDEDTAHLGEALNPTARHAPHRRPTETLLPAMAA